MPSEAIAISLKATSACGKMWYLADLIALGMIFILQAVLNSLKIGELLPNNALMDWISDKTCKDKDIFQPICSTIIFMIAGWDIPQLDTSMIDQIATHTPAGASSHTVWWDFF